MKADHQDHLPHQANFWNWNRSTAQSLTLQAVPAMKTLRQIERDRLRVSIELPGQLIFHYRRTGNCHLLSDSVETSLPGNGSRNGNHIGAGAPLRETGGRWTTKNRQGDHARCAQSKMLNQTPGGKSKPGTLPLSAITISGPAGGDLLVP